MSLYFSAETAAGKQLMEWWQTLEDNTGERALLRRATCVNEVAMSRAFYQLYQRMQPLISTGSWEDSLAAIAGLAAHVRTISTDDLAKQMAAGKPPRVSELRFRRLLQRDRDDLYTAMIRIIKMLDHKANLFDLANSVFFWGGKVKKRWAYCYFPNI